MADRQSLSGVRVPDVTPGTGDELTTKTYTDAAAADAVRPVRYPAWEFGFYGWSIPIDQISSITATAGPDSALQVSSGSLELTRIWIPANTALLGVAAYVAVAGSGVTTTAYQGFAIYSDAGALLGNTPRDTTLFASTGLKAVNMSAIIPAQSAGRFVLAGMMNSLPTGPRFGSSRQLTAAITNFKTGGARHNRVVFQTGNVGATPPASITPNTMSLDDRVPFVGIY